MGNRGQHKTARGLGDPADENTDLMNHQGRNEELMAEELANMVLTGGRKRGRLLATRLDASLTRSSSGEDAQTPPEFGYQR